MACIASATPRGSTAAGTSRLTHALQAARPREGSCRRPPQRANALACRRKVLLAGLLLTLGSGGVNAQSPVESDGSSEELRENIVVTASRTPLPAEQASASFTVLDEQHLERRSALTLEELLRGTPGMAVSRGGVLGSLAQVRLRGAEANHTLVLMDGIEIGDPALGGEIDFSHFLAANLRRIEIVRGPLSALWGSDAVAGVINLISAPETYEQSLITSTEAGQFNTRKGGLKASAGGDGWGLGAWAHHLSSDGQNISRTGDEADGYRNNTGLLTARFDPSPTVSLRLVARHSNSENQHDATSFLTGVPADSDNSTQRSHTVVGLQGSAATFAGRWNHRASLAHIASENHNFAAGTETGETSGDKLRVSYQSTFLLPQLAGNARPSITLGFEHESEDYLQRAAASAFGDPNRDLSTRSNGAMAEFRLDAPRDWSAAAALRHDRNEDFEDAVSWRLSVLRWLGSDTALHAAYGTGVKSPSFIERFGYFSNFIGNPDLEPETSRGWELGLRYGNRNGTFSGALTWFKDRLLDEINGFVFDPAAGGFTAANRSGVSQRRGLEAQARMTLTPKLAIAGAYTWLKASEPDSANSSVEEVRRPRHSGSLNIHYEIAAPAIGINLNLAWTGEQPDVFYPPWPNPSRRVSLDAFLLASLTASWQATSRMRWHIRAENLGNARFEEVYGFRGPGRSIHLGAQFSFFGEGSGQ